MLTASDLIRLPYTPDLTQAGIAYVCRWLACTYLAENQKTYISMRDLVVDVAANLAFQRYLNSEHIPHTVLTNIFLEDPICYAFLLGDRRCFLKVNLVFDRKVIHTLCSKPDKILRRQAELDLADLDYERMPDEDLIIQALVPAIITRRPKELVNALVAGKPVCLMHTLSAAWANPLPENHFEEIAIKSNHHRDITVEMGDRDLDGNFQEEKLVLQPHRWIPLECSYQSLAYLRLDHPITSPITLSNKVQKVPCIIQPGQWGNIWIYGMEIILAGYLSRLEFRRKAAILAQKTGEFPVSSGKKKNLPIGELRPLAGVFEWANKI